METDYNLACKVRENCDNEALQELIDRHSGIYVKMVKRHAPSSSIYGHQIEDLMDEKDMIIYQAALKFDNEKSKFSTYLANLAVYACLSFREKNKKNNKTVPIEDYEFVLESDDSPTSDKMIKSETYEMFARFIRSSTNNKVKKVFSNRYDLGSNHKLTPWVKVGESVGLTAQACINIHNKTLQEFKKKLENEKS
jgi:DNA-directed RNA polymerase sigma subunit (sigma70/sigma32)